MKICILAPLYHPYEHGGLESYVAELVQQLRGRGHQVAIITRDAVSGSLPDTGYGEIFRIKRTAFQAFLHGPRRRSPAWFMMHTSEMFSRRSARAARRIIAEWQPDVLFSQSFFGFGRGLPQMLGRTGLPWVHSVHSYDLVCKRQTAVDWKGDVCQTPCADCRAICAFKYGRQPLRKTTAIYNSRHMRLYFEQAGILTAGAEVIDPVFDYEGKEVRADYRPSTPVRLFYVGRVSNEKGIQLLCEAIARSGGAFRLEVLGDGKLLAELRAKYGQGPDIAFHGRVSPEERDRMLAAADALVVPSLWNEPFGRVIQEGYLAGVPVIAANMGSMGNLMRHGVDGFVFAWEKGNELASLAEALRQAAPLLPRLREGALETRTRLMARDNCSRIEALLVHAVQPAAEAAVTAH